MMKRLLCLGILLAIATPAFADSCAESCSSSCTDGARGCAEGIDACGRPDFLPFSQGEQRARDYMGQAHLQNLVDMDDWNWVLSAALSYDQNFDKDDLGKHFSPSGCNCFTVGPDNTSGVHVRAEDLGLSPTFRGTLCFRPEVRNLIFEPALHLGIDRWVEGLFLWTKIPLTWTNWDLELCETASQSGGPNFATNLMDVGNDPVAVGAKTIKAAFKGDATWGDKTEGLQAGRLLSSSKSQFGIADIPLHIGWNFITRDKGYFGLYVRTVFPTGSKENRQSIFDPRVGYDRWQLGGGLQGRMELYNKDDETSINAFTDLYVTHIFDKSECRLFDKVGNGPWSRYLLLKEFNASNTYTGVLKNWADVFTVCVESGFNWNVSFLFFLELKHSGWTADLGYELKARDCESIDSDSMKICCPENEDCEDACSSSSNKYGVKGIQLVSDNRYDNGATIKIASLAEGAGTVATSDATGLFSITDIKTRVDLESGRRPRMLSHKIFSNFGYTWEDRDYPVFTNVGLEVEFGSNNKTLQHWGLWGKIGVAYN